jgi:hypothetical protein
MSHVAASWADDTEKAFLRAGNGAHLKPVFAKVL